MRAQEFIIERKKRSKKTSGLGGYFFPGYGLYGGDAGEGGGDGGGGGESIQVKEDADGQQVLDYIHGTHHEPLTTQLQQAVLSYPRWELRSVPISSLHIPDQEYDDEEQEPEADPYNRVQVIDPDHAGEYSANFVDRRPIVVDAEGWIIDGNHRAWAAAELLNRPTIRAWVPAKQGVTEAFDQPYRTKSEKSDYGDIDMLAKLPDGTNLSIMFNNQGDDEWQVEFYRDNSQEVTGGGDAQRVFATVLTSMQKFIKKYKPWRLTFSANKDVEPGQNSESRAKLYNRLVQRYAAAWGYEEYSEDHGDQITYELTQLKPSVAENFTNNQSLKSNVVNAIRKALPMAQEIWFHGSRAIGRHRPDSDTDILVVVPDDVVGDDYIGAVRTLQKVSKQFDNYDIQPTKHSSNIYQIAQEEGQLLWSATNENFADGKIKGKSRPGRVKRAGASCDGSVTDLRARAKNASGEKARMYHWCANMKSGRKKTNEVTVGVLTLGEFTVNIDDHALDRAQERRIKSTDIDTVLKKIKLPRVIKKIMAIDLGSRFYVLDHSSNVALGFRRIGNKKLVLKTVYPGRPMDHNIATIITI